MERKSIIFISPVYYLICVLTSILCFPPIAFSQEGRLVTVIVHSEALEGNLLGDNPKRDVSIYFPSTYDENPNTRFPVIYLLHGYTWTNDEYDYRLGIKGLIDSFSRSDIAKQMIVVIPNAYNKPSSCIKV